MRTLIVALAVVACATPALAQATGAGARTLILPFDNGTDDPQRYWLTEAAAVILTDDLAALGAPVIRRDDRLRAFERLRVPAVATLSHATVIRLGQLLGATDVIIGTFEAQGDRITVAVRTIRLDTGRMAPEIVESGPLSGIFEVFARIASRLVPSSPVTPEQMEQGHPPIAALEQYIKGLLAQAPATKVSFLNQAIRLAPGFYRPRIALWRAYAEQDEHQLALGAVRDVPAGHRQAREARFLAAISLVHLARYQEAFDAFTALNTSAPDPSLFNNLGVVQLRRPAGAPGGRAVWFFSEASRLDGADPDLFFNLGYAYWLEGDAQAAMHWLREAVRRDPADHAAHYVLGVALRAAGSLAEAAREHELAKRLSSEYEEWEAKQPANAVPPGLERVKSDVDVPSALRVENVIVAAEQRDLRELAAFHLEAGRRAYQAERDAEAISELRRAVYLSPYHAEAHLLLGRAYLRSGRGAEAIDAFKIAIWSEDTIAAHLALAEAYLRMRDEEAARAELEWVLKHDARHADANRLLEEIGR